MVDGTNAQNIDYKTQRLREMADMWKGTVLENRTVPLLAMLLAEDGTLTAERRGDCAHGGCFAFGIMQWHICQRAYKGRHYCHWKNGKHPQQQFEEENPEFAWDWRIQFAEFTRIVTELTEQGRTVDWIIWSWNTKEEGRREKIRRREYTVRHILFLPL